MTLRDAQARVARFDDGIARCARRRFPRRGVARNRHPHRGARRVPAGSGRPADAAVPQRMGRAARRTAALADGKTVALPRVDPATRMLRCLRIARPRRATSRRATAASPSRAPLPRHRRRNDRLGAGARRGVRCRRPAAGLRRRLLRPAAAAAARPACRASPARSTRSSSTRCRRRRTTSASMHRHRATAARVRTHCRVMRERTCAGRRPVAAQRAIVVR